MNWDVIEWSAQAEVIGHNVEAALNNFPLNEFDLAILQIFEEVSIQIGNVYGFNWVPANDFEEKVVSRENLDLLHALVAEIEVEKTLSSV